MRLDDFNVSSIKTAIIVVPTDKEWFYNLSISKNAEKWWKPVPAALKQRKPSKLVVFAHGQMFCEANCFLISGGARTTKQCGAEHTDSLIL